MFLVSLYGYHSCAIVLNFSLPLCLLHAGCGAEFYVGLFSAYLNHYGSQVIGLELFQVLGY